MNEQTDKQIYELKHSLRKQEGLINELLNKKPKEIIFETNSQTFNISKNDGPEATVYFINDKTPDANTFNKDEDTTETEDVIITNFSRWCWIVSTFTFNGEWLAPSIEYTCSTSKAYTPGWTGGDDIDIAVWTQRGGKCTENQDCKEWADNVTVPGAGDVPYSVSGSTFSESLASQSAEPLDDCEDGNVECDYSCTDGFEYSGVYVDYPACKDQLDYYMSKMNQDCLDDSQTNLCGWKDYTACVWHSNGYFFSVSSCCCAEEDVNCPIEHSQIEHNFVYGTITKNYPYNCEHKVGLTSGGQASITIEGQTDIVVYASPNALAHCSAEIGSYTHNTAVSGDFLVSGVKNSQVSATFIQARWEWNAVSSQCYQTAYGPPAAGSVLFFRDSLS